MRPIRLLHLLDALLSQAGVASQGSGVFQRRQRQRLALMQRLLNPLPGQLHHCFDDVRWSSRGNRLQLAVSRQRAELLTPAGGWGSQDRQARP